MSLCMTTFKKRKKNILFLVSILLLDFNILILYTVHMHITNLSNILDVNTSTCTHSLVCGSTIDC